MRNYMKLTNIEIKNFRGIKKASIFFPVNSRVLCIIGPGDSGKSTLLSAIEWALWPTWNLNVTDMDFFDCDPSNTIEISASITELPDIFIKEDKYGLYLRDFEKTRNGAKDDEPEDNGIPIITINLTIDETLEPKWNVITNRTEPKPIGQKDRRLLSFGLVGFDYEKDFHWGRNSVLQKYTNSRDVLRDAFTQAIRELVKNTNLNALDGMISTLMEIGQKYGVTFNGNIHNRLLMQNGLYSSSVGIFDDKVPFFQRGLGSKRLLSIGMNVNSFQDGTLVLIDEVETGLEPYRISTLVNHFRSHFKDSGQLIMTTHSTSTLCECTVEEIAVCSKILGELSLHCLELNENSKDKIQSLLRSNPDAFLCKRVIVCEGKTEVGILRSLDKYRASKGLPRFAHFGVGIIPGGGGNNFFDLTKLLHRCGYDVSILMDSDVHNQEPQKQEIRNLDISIFAWEKDCAIEEQIFKDASVKCLNAMIAIAIEEKSFEHVNMKMAEAFPEENRPYIIRDRNIFVCDCISEKDRILIGTIAKNSKWYKNISQGEMIGDKIFEEYETMSSCRFKDKMMELQKWVSGDES